MPQINGVLETAIYVDDLAHSAAWYRDIFGFSILLQDDRLCAFDVGGSDVLLLFKKGESVGGAQMPGGFIPPHDATGQIHFAFAISPDDYSIWRDHLTKKGVEVQSEVSAPRGGQSLYLRDPDGHLVELATPGLWEIY